MDFRNYDASIGRFLNIDPLTEVAKNWTPYRFAFNNPVYYTDPSGLIEFKYDNNNNVTGFSTSNTNEINAILEYYSNNSGASFNDVENFVLKDMNTNENPIFSLELGEAVIKNKTKTEKILNGLKTYTTDMFSPQFEIAQISVNAAVNGLYGASAYLYYSISLGDDIAARHKVNYELNPIIPTKSYGFRKGKLEEIDWGNMKEQQRIDYILALGIKYGTMLIPTINIINKAPDKVNDIIKDELIKKLEKDIIEGGRFSLD